MMFTILNQMQRIFGEHHYGTLIMEIMTYHSNVVALDADLISASGARKAWLTYPDRFYNVGVAEANMMGIAAGLSMTGLVPFVHTFACFATRRAYDQVYLSGAYANNNIKICASDGGFNIGINGGTHTSYEDLGMMRMMPSVVVVEPCDETQLRWTMKEIINQYGIHYIRVFRKPARNIYKPDSTFSLGKGNVLRIGKEATIIACGAMVFEALKAAEILEEKGFQVGVIDMFSIKPIDIDLVLESARNSKMIVTAENHNVIGGLGSAVAEVLADNGCGVPLRRIGCQDRFGQVGSSDFLQKEYGMTYEEIIASIESVLVK